MNNVCLVIPMYNEEIRFNPDIIRQYLNHNPECGLILVDDGSLDGTKKVIKILKQVYPSRVNTLFLPTNLGKGPAIWAAIEEFKSEILKKYEYFGYIDADLSFNPNYLQYFFAYSYKKPYHKVLIGSRLKILGCDINRNPLRHYLGRIFATVTSWLLDEPIYDTQCGVKVFHSDLLETLFAEKFLTKWLFDVEIFYRMKYKTENFTIQRNVIEIPLPEWKNQPKSKVNWRDFLLSPFELLTIHFHYNRYR